MKRALLWCGSVGLLVAAACARRGSPGAPAPLAVTRLGTPDLFGPGIVVAASDSVQFVLTRPAYVIVLHVDADGSIDPAFPRRTGESTTSVPQGPGAYVVIAHDSAPAARALPPEPVIRSAAALARHGQQAPPPPADPGAPAQSYWLVIAADVATSAREVRMRLQAMRLQFPSLEGELKALPRALVATRTGNWAAYYVPAAP
ncbi:MAG TPA: hypothetical protein VH116_04625 [Gemmatimonadales bacterium]|jgi:hypothetical protein|nr:hypothetical protein [Gemmatimonadales bacterium]